MRTLYNKIYTLIYQLDYNRIWRGFHPYPFALYNKKLVFLSNKEIPYNTSFRGNTSILWDGSYMAIWRVEDEEKYDVEVLAAEIVHEMFHAFQQEMGEERFPDDFKLLCYPNDNKNLSLKYKENQILARAIVEQDRIEVLKLLRYVNSYRKRRELLVREFIWEEYRTEVLEGMAEYAALIALKMFNLQFYEKRIEDYKNLLIKANSMQIDIRRISYVTGAVIMLLFINAGIDIFHIIGVEKKTVWELGADYLEIKEIEELGEIKELDIEPSMEIESYLQEKLQNCKHQLCSFFKSRRRKINRKGIITGYDPMNMIKYGKLLLCTHFAEIVFQDDEKCTEFTGPLVLQLEEEAGKVISCYYT